MYYCNNNSHVSLPVMHGKGNNTYAAMPQRSVPFYRQQFIDHSPPPPPPPPGHQHHQHQHQNHQQSRMMEPSRATQNAHFMQMSAVPTNRHYINDYSLPSGGYQRFNYNIRQHHQKTPISYEDERYQKQLIVNYLAPDVSSEELHKLFSCFGPLDGAKIIYDRQTGQTKGYGFVYFCYPESARRAVEQMNGFEFRGKRLKVGYSTNPLHIIPNAAPQYMAETIS